MLSKGIKISAAVLAVIISLTSCTYYPPEGYTEQHHTYEEALAFAEAIDPSTVLDEEYSDTISDSWNLNFREWNAVINGISCHVASAGELVWNRGFLGGEFPKEFYRMDTDYDYYILESVLAEKQPEWRIAYTDVYSRYDPRGCIYVKNSYPTGRKLTDEELDSFFIEVSEIEEAYNDKCLNRSVGFYLSAPTVHMNGSTGENKYVIIDEIAFFNISENGKTLFLDEYNSKWDKLNAGLPIKQ